MLLVITVNIYNKLKINTHSWKRNKRITSLRW